MPASDSNPLLRLGIHRTSIYSSCPTGVVGADWKRPTGNARSVETQETGGASKAGLSSQPQYRGPYPTHLQNSIVTSCQKGALQPSRHVRTRTVLWTLTFAIPEEHDGAYHMHLGVNSIVGADKLSCTRWCGQQD